MTNVNLSTRILLVGMVVLFAADAEDNAPNPFFAFKNSMESGGPASVDEQVKILKELGFDGFDNRDLNDLPAALAALDREGLKLCSIYFTVRIDPEEEPFNPDLEAALPLLKERSTVLWCNTHSKRFKPSDPAGDKFAVPIFQRIADLAAPYGVRVATYPHIGLWVETPQDTARLADKVKRPNFGTSFNLFHWNALGERKLPLDEVVRIVGPRMFLMSINGDVGPHNIGPLEEDDIETYYGVLKAFRDAGYRGPVGLQCYLIPGDPRTHLGQSFAVWTSLKERLAKETATP
ncbi:MAG: TIM barrel protein [Candidatus Hydrogenedentes bacterium]|nr:TIM barrel protein [Candidatus Hydrogenedentota bacterium]